MADVYRLIHPVKYFNDYLEKDTRPDGRKFDEHRSVRLNISSVNTADASAVVKCGNTAVVCGIKLELATPKAEAPESGFLITNVELPPICSPKSRPGPPSDYAQITSNIVSDIITNSKCVDVKDLCIVPDKLAWVVYCDMVCLDNDGSIVDSCIMSLLACLRTLTLPTVTYDPETEEISVDDKMRKPLNVKGCPVSTSFSLYSLDNNRLLLTDPTNYEEEMCGGVGSNLIICYNKGVYCGQYKFGGKSVTIECQDNALEIAKLRSTLVEEIIDTCITKK